MADETLKYVVRLCQWGIVWTTFDDLFINWLDTMSRFSQFATVSFLDPCFGEILYLYLPHIACFL